MNEDWTRTDADGNIPKAVQDSVLGELRQAFRPEFLNRIDETVLFSTLTQPEMRRIVELLLDDVRSRLTEQRIQLEIAGEALDHMAREGYDPVYGARPMKRYLQRVVETPLARRIIAGEVPEGSTVRVSVQDQEVHLLVEVASSDSDTPVPEPS